MQIAESAALTDASEQYRAEARRHKKAQFEADRLQAIAAGYNQSVSDAVNIPGIQTGQLVAVLESQGVDVFRGSNGGNCFVRDGDINQKVVRCVESFAQKAAFEADEQKREGRGRKHD